MYGRRITFNTAPHQTRFTDVTLAPATAALTAKHFSFLVSMEGFFLVNLDYSMSGPVSTRMNDHDQHL